MSDHSDITMLYDSTAERVQKAWLTFVKLYTLEHPQPGKPRWYRQVPVTLIVFGIVAAAGMLLSALRTAPTFKDIAVQAVGVELATLEAILAIVVIELFLVTVRYVFVVQRGSVEIDDATMRWMLTGFWVAFIVAMAGNLYSTTKDLPVLSEIRDTLDLMASLIIGASAPLLAVISGDIMGLLYLKSEAHRTALRQQYERELATWTSARDERWKLDRSRYGATIRIQNEPTPVVSTPPVLPRLASRETGRDETARRSGYGFQRTADGETQVFEYFRTHPDEVMDKVRDLELRIGVSKSTVSRARRKWLDGQGGTNGHGGQSGD